MAIRPGMLTAEKLRERRQARLAGNGHTAAGEGPDDIAVQPTPPVVEDTDEDEDEDAEGSESMSYHGDAEDFEPSDDDEETDQSLEEAANELNANDGFGDVEDPEDEDAGEVEFASDGEDDEDEGPDASDDSDDDTDFGSDDGDDIGDEDGSDDSDDDTADFGGDGSDDDADDMDDSDFGDDEPDLEAAEGDDDDMSDESDDDLDGSEDADDDDACGSGMRHSSDEEDEDTEEEDSDEEDAEPSSLSRPTSSEPGKPMPHTFFGPPPDAGSSVASVYKCSSCDFAGVATKPAVNTASVRRDVREQLEPLAASYGIEVGFKTTNDGVAVNLASGGVKMFASLVESAESMFDVQRKSKTLFTIKGSAQVFCPVCASSCKERKTASVKTAGLDLKPGFKFKFKQAGKLDAARSGVGTTLKVNPEDTWVVVTVGNSGCYIKNTDSKEKSVKYYVYYVYNVDLLPLIAPASDGSVASVKFDTRIASYGKCKKHGKMFASKSADVVMAFCTVCADAVQSEKLDVVVPVADMASMPEKLEDGSVTASLHEVNTKDPFWNVFYKGLPVARVKLSGYAEPQEIRNQFVQASFGKGLVQAIDMRGLPHVLSTLNAEMYVAKAESHEIVAKTQKRMKLAANRLLTAEKAALLDNFASCFTLASNGFEKNLFPNEGHSLKAKLADCLADSGAADPEGITEDVMSSGVLANYMEQCFQKAAEFMEMDQKELQGQARVITGSAVQDVRPANTAADVRRRMVASTVPAKPVAPTDFSKEDRKAEIRSRFNFNGARVKRQN